MHTHADEVAAMSRAENFVRMGVTAVVAGNCGSSTLNVARLFRAVERTNVAVNVATLVGHNSVRGKAMGGSFARRPAPQELARMKALVEQAMKDGAVGLSTGLIYQPGVFAQTDEIVEQLGGARPARNGRDICSFCRPGAPTGRACKQALNADVAVA